MGTNILVPDADFSASAVGFDAAVTDGLVGIWFFNRGVRDSRKNLALGGVDADVLGAPSDQGSFIRFKGGQSFFQTAVPDTQAFTHIVALKSTDTMADQAHSPMWVSNFGSGEVGGGNAGTVGASMFSFSSTAILTCSASRYTDATNTTITSAGRNINNSDFTAWRMFASRSRSDRTQADNLTVADAQASNYTTQARVLGAGNFRIGSSFSAAWQGSADVAAVVMYSRYITDGELSTMAGQVRNVLAHIGITV